MIFTIHGFVFMKQVRRTALYLSAAVLIAGVGWHGHKWYSSHYETVHPRRIAATGYRFTSPLLDVELPEGITINREPLHFKYKIEAYIREQIEKGQVRIVAVYFRDLLDGPWFGINENIEFNPASLMKVPVMIAWLKRAEKDPSILKRKMTFAVRDNSVPKPFTKPAREIEFGKSYTVDELLHYMLNYSDNNATAHLFKALTHQELGDVLDNMDVHNNPTQDGNLVTVDGYSGFFRILYNAAYLNREMSEKALKLLALDDFPQGMVAGVPPRTVVATKFGEVVPADDEDIQLHEFGIIYHPSSPYILGIMTMGRDFATQEQVIRDISRMIYSEFDSMRVTSE
jgi:beta-lactamase class A